MKAARQAVVYVAEPPAAYRLRPPVVVDCSVLAALLFGEPARDVAAGLVAHRELHAPWLLDHEFASVAERKRRAGLDPERALAGVAAYAEYPIALHRAAPEAVLPLASRYALSPYDAAYLLVATELRTPLMTFDHKLGKAAMRHLGTLE